MTGLKTSYRLASSMPDNVARELGSHSPLVQQLLYNRNLLQKKDVTDFLTPSYDMLHDPFLMTDMERAVVRILEAIQKKERIAIYSDYDCDGIPGGVLLHDFFAGIGYEYFENYIPHRHHEGYGLNTEALDTLHKRGATLVITVDCGITDVAPAVHAHSLGIDLIITDHHELGAELPPAYAVLNPKRDDKYPFPGLCGTGVAWKLITALLARGKKEGVLELPDGHEKWWLDVVGIATVADMVPLSGENRVLAYYGLKVLQKTRRPGLQQLLRTVRINPRHITEDDIGFMIGPRINAASRMDTPEDAFHMLASQDERDAGAHARHLEKLNNERKGVVAAMVKEIKKRTTMMSDMRPVLVMGNPEWRPALVGLAANTLAETFGRPVFLWGRDGQNVIRGSCRAGSEVSVVSLMQEAGDALLGYGGHHAAGGFSVHADKIHTLDKNLNIAHATIAKKGVVSTVEKIVDAKLLLEDISDTLVRDLARLAPFGEGNAKPLFAFQGVVPVEVEQFGKGRDHMRVQLEKRNGTQEAMAFFSTYDTFTTPLEPKKPVTIIGHVEQSFFMNRPSIRLRIVDVLPPNFDLC